MKATTPSKPCGPSLTTEELVDECKKHGKTGYSRLRKAELVGLCCENVVSPKNRAIGLSPGDRDVINRSVLGALRGIGSDCKVERFSSKAIDYGCEHDKGDGVIFESRRKYEDDIDEMDEGEDPNDFVEDDDFPNFIGKKIVESTVEKAAVVAGFPGKAIAQDHEKGFYNVLFELK